MGAQSNAAPIIIKKKRVSGGDGHHGGAWKVAYADFVTAMMAFFMLMWLLNATTETQRKGLADYFSPTIPVNPVSGGGDGAFGGDNMFSEQTMVMDGSGASNQEPHRGENRRADPPAWTRKAAAKARSKISRHLRRSCWGVRWGKPGVR